MLNTKLLYKSMRLSALSGITLLACLVAGGLLLFLEMIVGVTYDGVWFLGVYLFIGILIVNMILCITGIIGSRRLYNSEDWLELERAARKAADAAMAGDIGSVGMSDGQKAAFAGGFAAVAGGRVAKAAGSFAGSEKAQKAGDVASAAGTAVMAAAMFAGSRKEREHTIAMMDLLGVERRALHVSRNLLLVEVCLFVVLYIPAFFLLRADYIETSGALEEACDEITQDLEDTGLLDAAHSSVYKDDYATIHAYLDEEHYCYAMLDMEKDGSISGITYHLGIEGAEDEVEAAAEAANEAFALLYAALGETAAADTAYYLWFEIDDEVAEYVADGSYYNEVNGDVEITCNYGYDEYDDCPYFYVWME